MYSKTSRNYYRSLRKKYRRTSPLKIVCFLLAAALVAFVATYAFCTIVLNKNANETKPEATNEPKTTETSYTMNGSTIAETISMNPIQKDIATQIITDAMTTDIATESEKEEEVLPQIYEGEFELPLQGATVYALANAKLCDDSGNKQTVNAGDALRIVSEEGDELVVTTADGFTGKISSYKVMINLADVIPSIVYMDTNSVESVFQSSGYDIPGVTGVQFYDVWQYNERLGRTEFNMPIIFATAKKVMAAQQMALSEGYSLKIVETYRPMDTQNQVITNLDALANTNSEVLDGITGKPWNKSWFIAQSISNHQRGYAMDLTLVEVVETEICTSGDYAYVNVCDYADVQMPTPIHELSMASATFTKPVPSRDATAWQGKELAPSMNEVAIRLQNYCTSAGFTPLASEWWHFNDLDAMNSSAGSLSDGGYFLQPNLSVIP